MKSKAQGTIEYLIIVAIVIIIALVVVGILLSLNPASGIAEQNARLSWKSTTPWAITDWYSNEEELQLTIQNNSPNDLQLNFITIEETSTTINERVTTGKEINVVISKPCSGFYAYRNIEINYNTTLLNDRKQLGQSEIIGQCS